MNALSLKSFLKSTQVIRITAYIHDFLMEHQGHDFHAMNHTRLD